MRFWLLLMGITLVPLTASAQGWRPGQKEPAPAPHIDTVAFGRYRLLPRSRLTPQARVLRAPATTVGETEPNDTVAAANLVTLGDTVAGTISPVGDIDFFAVDLTAGTQLDLDVDAAQFGSLLDPVIGLFDVDGVTLLVVNDDYDGLDSRIIYGIPADGRYYVAIVDYGGGGGAGYTYTLNFGVFRVDEVEPNDTPGQANVIALGDSIWGVISPATDRDYFAVAVPAGGYLRASLLSEFPSGLALFDADGTTLLDSSNALQSYPVRVSAYAATGATWYLQVRNIDSSYGGQLYQLVADTLPTGPGDPTTLFATNVPGPVLTVADAAGGLYVLGDFGGGLYHVSSSGAVTVVASGTFNASGLAIDGFGDVLIAAYVFQNSQAGVYKVGGTGQLTVVHQLNNLIGGLVVGPDGDIWVGDCGSVCPALRRVDPFGVLKSTTALPGTPRYLAFSPNGTLHYSDGFSTVYRLSGATSLAVLTLAPYVEDIAFDTDGYLYVANGFSGVVNLYDPSYQPVHVPFAATNLGGPLSLAFLRTTAGAMTARLLVSQVGYQQSPPYVNAIVELNPTGIRAVGARVGVDLISIITASLPAGVVGADYDQTLTTAVGAPSPLAWSIASGTLPTGLALGPATGVLAGVARAAGTFRFTVRVDGAGRLGLRAYTVQVTAPEVTVLGAMDAALGVDGALSDDQMRYLDIVGNDNGEFDIGDLRALLRRQGALSRTGVTQIVPAIGRN